MVRRSMKYNPTFLSEQELIDAFVVRHKDLDLVMQIIRENLNASNQHILITGPRGIGKTMLLLRVAAEINKSKDLSKIWYPLKFAEESYRVSTPGEFWLNAVFHLGEQTKEKQWQETWEELNDVSDENHLRERALAKLMDFADQQDKRVLLIVENLNMLLSDQLSKDDAWKIRHTLQNEPRIMLLSSAIKGFEDVEGIDRALFDAFITHELLPLDEKQCEKIWVETTGKEVTDNRARPIQILTGGSPRLVKIISIFGANLSFRELMTDLTHLVDDHTDYFKSQIETLPPLERKVFVSLAELWDPSSSLDVTKLARLSINKTSSLLNRLLGRGIVALSGKKGRTKLYQVAERMFNIYYLMRSRGVKSHRVKVIVKFLIDFYDISEILDKTRQLAEEALTLKPGYREDHYLAIEEILKHPSTEPIREKILEETPREFFNTPQISDSLKEMFLTKEHFDSTQEMRKFISDLKKTPRNSESLKIIEKKLTQAFNNFPNAPINLLKMGCFHAVYSGRYEKEEDAYQKAIELNPKIYEAWALLGHLLHEKLERYDEAEDAYRKAIELNSDSIYSYGNLFSLLLINRENPNDALKFAKKTQLNFPDNPSLFNSFAWSVFENKKYELLPQAEKWIRKSLNISQDKAIYHHTLSTILLEQDKASAALEPLEQYLADSKVVAETLKDANDLLINFAARGYGNEALKILLESPSNDILEPLVVGLQLYLGKEVRTALEIEEIGKDVVKRIEKRKMEIGMP